MASDMSAAPTQKDEEFALEFVQLEEDTNLRVSGDEARECADCHFFTDGDAAISYCWNDRLGIMVAGEWLCDHWAEAGSSGLEMTDVQQAIADKKWRRLVEANAWRTEPQDGRQCSGCLYFNSPDKDISYCWNPNLQVEVGHDHWCTYWEQGPSA